MLKNSQILPIFGLGLILSTSPLFTLLDSSIVSPETVNEDSSVKLKEEQEEEEVREELLVEDSKESSSVASTTTPTEETLPKEPSSETSTTAQESQVKEDSAKSEESLTSTVDSSAQQESLPSEGSSSAQQHEHQVSTVDNTPSETKESESTTTTHSQVTKSVTPEAITSAVSTSTSTEPFAVAKDSPSSSSLKTPEVSSTTQTNKGSQPSKIPESTVSQMQGRKKRGYIRDYTANEKTNTQGLRSVTFNNGESKFLYSIDKDVDFSIPSNLDPKKFQRIPVENIQISLFKKTAWSSTKSVDEYERIDKNKVKELFALAGNDKDKKENKLRQLLVSLSNRRVWSFHKEDTTFNSELKTAEIVWKTDVKDSELNLEIKYFPEYKNLKDYVEERLKECSSAEFKGPCLATEDELTIIDQDKKTFFADSKKKK